MTERVNSDVIETLSVLELKGMTTEFYWS